MTDLQFPIGRFKLDGTPTDGQVRQAINEIAEAPAKLRAAVEGLTAEQLDTPYRPGGWTVRQVVHHVPDSHLNSYCRFKLALTEDEPTIKAYHEDRWAELDDARTGPIEVSLAMLESLHKRWLLMLKSLTPDDFERTFRHPEIGVVSLAKNVCLYGWHGRHHVAHIASLCERMAWE
ncbi:MAG: YfiT family bacillithiol transferase [Acidobacteriota bacterium]